MNHQEFEAVVKRLQKDTDHFSNITAEVVDGCDEAKFDMQYISLDEMDRVKKTLKIRRMPLTDSEGDPVPAILAGKIIITELQKCPTCSHEKWKNVTRQVGAKLLGGSVVGW